MCARSGIEMIAASSLSEARRHLAFHGRKTFDVVLTEISLPDGSGLDLLENIAAIEPAPPIAVISAHLDNQLAMILHRRSIAFLFKPVTLNDLLTLISDPLQSPEQQLLMPRGRASVDAYATAFQLTRRERGVLDHCVAGLGREETAAALGISVGTVHRTWLRILARTGNTTQDALLRRLIRYLAEVPIRASTLPPRIPSE